MKMSINRASGWSHVHGKPTDQVTANAVMSGSRQRSVRTRQEPGWAGPGYCADCLLKDTVGSIGCGTNLGH